MIWLILATLVGGGAIVAARESLRRLPAWRENRRYDDGVYRELK